MQARHPTTPESAAGRLDIDLAALASNYRMLATKTGTRPAAMVKADGYGIGLEPVVRQLRLTGCRQFFVARLGEAELARNVLDGETEAGQASDALQAREPEEVLLLDGVAAGAEQALLDLKITPVLNSLEQIDRWARAAREAGRPLPGALHVDTGMHRLGLPADEWSVLQTQTHRLDGIDVCHVLSHLACADDDAVALANGALAGPSAHQLARFRTIREHFPGATASLANSAGIFCGPEYFFDLTRPGIALYGGSPWGTAHPNPMLPVATATVPVVQVQNVEAGEAVGYGGSWRASETTRIATLPVGYADGYHRALSGVGSVVVAATGQRAPIVGRVSMDLTTVDVGHVPEGSVIPGTEIELFGAQLPIDEVADAAQTIAYELLTSLGRRYRRTYRNPG